jgi:hypothetical protein
MEVRQMEAQQTVQIPADVLIQRIDAMTRELLDLRRLILAQTAPQDQAHASDLVAQLAGALGQGSWEEYEDDVEWERFAL